MIQLLWLRQWEHQLVIPVCYLRIQSKTDSAVTSFKEVPTNDNISLMFDLCIDYIFIRFVKKLDKKNWPLENFTIDTGWVHLCHCYPVSFAVSCCLSWIRQMNRELFRLRCRQQLKANHKLPSFFSLFKWLHASSQIVKVILENFFRISYI